MSSRLIHVWAASALVASAVAIACTGKLDIPRSSPTSGGGSSGTPVGTTDDGGPQVPFEPVSARLYVAKVKNLMLGLPPTEDEISAVRDMDSCACWNIGSALKLSTLS